MGDTQSAQREVKKDAAEEDEDVQITQITEDKPLSNTRQISGMNEKADGAIAEVNDCCEDEVAAEAVILPEGAEREKPCKEEETPLEKLKEKESPDTYDAAPADMIEMEAKQNDINENFRRFFSNIGLKLTVKKSSGENAEKASDVLFETSKEEPDRLNEVEHTTNETKSSNTGQKVDWNLAQETCDNDSTTCPTLTEITSENIQDNVEEIKTKTTETKEEAGSENSARTTSLSGKEDTTPEEELDGISPSSPDEEVLASPFKRFFTTGIFSGLRKKRKSAEVIVEKELVGMQKQEAVETMKDCVQDQELEKEESSPTVGTATVEMEQRQNAVKEEILSATSGQSTDAPEVRENPLEGTSPPREPLIIVNEAEILSSQEKVKVQGSPLKRLLSGSSFKKLSKKQKGRRSRSSDSRLSDSGEHVSDQLLSSTESAEHQREKSPVQPPEEAAGEEEGTWASFKKLMTPKKRMKRSSLTNEEATIASSLEEPKPSEGEQASDHSTEEVKKQKDSSVSWEAVLCGSRRSQKTSDSEDETPKAENDDKKRDLESRNGAESPLESSNEGGELSASSSKQTESPSEGDGGSKWNSLKRLVTPKRKTKNEEESKDKSDSEVSKDESSFSIKKLLLGQKKRKSAEKQDQVSSDEADREVQVSSDEDSETPAVVPLSEFDAAESEVLIQTWAVIERHTDDQQQEDILEPLLPTETRKVQDNNNPLENLTTAISASNEDFEDLTELSSKHQQLSDIPEEGVIEDTMTTLVSVTEEVARDDTIAEDLIEITSEAITAPEPVDIATEDETEMISAVSQLTESSKTSGNTTPVPAEYDVNQTDALLHQLIETISISMTASPCLNELRPERIVGSVTPQILKTSVKEEATFLERHQKSDTTCKMTDLNVEEVDAINELAAKGMSEVKEPVSSDVVSVVTAEITTEETDAADEVHQDEVSQALQQSITKFDRNNESQSLVECLSEINEAMSTPQILRLQFEDNHRIQLQVVDVDLKSAKTVVDTVLEVGVKQAKELIDVCQEMDNNVEYPSATMETDEEVISEENKITIQEVIHHIKLPEVDAVQSRIQDELVNSEQEIIKLPTAETEVGELVEFAEVDNQEVTADGPETFGERQVEGPDITSGNYAVSTDQQESEISMQDDKEDLVETEAGLKKSEVGIMAEDLTDELSVTKMSENEDVKAQQLQNAPSQIHTPSNTGLAAPQNTGLISSKVNAEFPSSLSSEFNIDIKFEQKKPQLSLPSTTERTEPMKHTDVSEVGVHPTEPAEQINATQRAESQKQTELTEATVQPTEIAEPETKLDSPEKASTSSPPTPLKVGDQAVEAVEQIKSVEKVMSSIQATEARQPVTQIETTVRTLLQSYPEFTAAGVSDTKAAEPIQQTEEESEQDVWLDAEENIKTPEETETVECVETETEVSTCDHDCKRHYERMGLIPSNIINCVGWTIKNEAIQPSNKGSKGC
ncbi:hypothetical protein LDENG_00087450 [Lucifuga dentata]|nr:hypothetical protein LDENG_00087450 [Lucifuga dentata]